MRKIVRFFGLIGKLKRQRRDLWNHLNISHSESVADHLFRTTLISWLLAEKNNLNSVKAIKISLFHDLVKIEKVGHEIYSPLLLSPKEFLNDYQKIKWFFEKWPALKLMKKTEPKKIKQEEKALQKIVSFLPSFLQKEVKELWFDFKNGFSQEARLVNLAEKLENFLQVLEYGQKNPKISFDNWLLWADQNFIHPPFSEIKKAIIKRFLERKGTDEKSDFFVEFLIEAGKLKRKTRIGSILIGAKEPENISEHIFRTMVIAWVLGKMAKLNEANLLKTSLFHDLCNVYLEDQSPYEGMLPPEKEKWQEIFDKWPRISLKEKQKKAREKYQREKEALLKLTQNLNSRFKKEIIYYWENYERGLNQEGRFVKQVNRIETFLTALEYSQLEKIRFYKSWLVGTKEKVDHPLLVKAISALEKEFTPVIKQTVQKP